jgi:dienelactone hydrolase
MSTRVASVVIALLGGALAAAGADFDPKTAFGYDATAPLDVRETGVADRDGIKVHDLTFAGAASGRTAAYWVEPAGQGPHPAVLFVHWYEPESADSNRTQFLDQAVTLGRRGAGSLLIETMWSDPAWFRARDVSKDYENSLRQVRDLRRAMDVLLSRPGVDRKRVAYVGHDFGAMYGAVMAGVDPRVTAGYALQAGTTSFADWFLLSSKLQGEARDGFVRQMAVLDPTRYIGAAGVPVLFQFSTKDFYVPKDKAEAFFAAAREPKKILWYEAGHGLDKQAIADRMAWLESVLLDRR